MYLKLAKIISSITQPPIICIPLFIIINLFLSDFHFEIFIELEIISLVFTTILPTIIIVHWAKKSGNDIDISNRKDRLIPLIIGTISYFIGFLVSSYFNIPVFLTLLLLCYSINTCIALLITSKWKISIHTTGLTGPVCALIILSGPFGALFGLLYPVLIWSRVTLKKHTMAQAVCGGIFGFIFTALEMYLFINMFNLNIVNIYSFIEVLSFIIAIVITPCILTVFAYLNKTNSLIFYFIELTVLGIFIVTLSMESLMIFILSTLTSILISYYGGRKFGWYNIIK